MDTSPDHIISLSPMRVRGNKIYAVSGFTVHTFFRAWLPLFQLNKQIVPTGVTTQE